MLSHPNHLKILICHSVYVEFGEVENSKQWHNFNLLPLKVDLLIINAEIGLSLPQKMGK